MTLIQGISLIMADQWNLIEHEVEGGESTFTPRYGFIFEERKMFNVVADNTLMPCVFLEEYRDGRYNVKFGIKKHTTVQLSFMKLCPFDGDAIDREAQRNTIEVEAVIPFIESFNNLRPFQEELQEFKFFTPPPRFDTNEVSIMLQFEVVFQLAK